MKNKFKIGDSVTVEDSNGHKFFGVVDAVPDDEINYYLVDCVIGGKGAFYESEIVRMSKFDLYKTARIRKSAPVGGAGQFVKVVGHINETLIDIEFINGVKACYHVSHLERFVF